MRIAELPWSFRSKAVQGAVEVMVTTISTLLLVLLVQSAAQSISPTRSTGFLRHDTNARRLTTKTIATTNCDAIRLEPYPFELQLLYQYSVEVKSGGGISLNELDDIKRAVDHAVANELNMCDGLGRPLFTVKTNSRHSFSKTAFCVPTVDPRNNICQVVTGATSLMVFDDSTFVRMEAAQAIANGLKNDAFFDAFANFVVRTEYRGPISEVVVYTPNGSEPDDSDSTFSPITTTVAIAAASLSFLVATIFCYGMVRKSELRRHPEPSVRHRSRSRKLVTRTIISGSRGGLSGPKRNFVRLEDLAASPKAFVSGGLASEEDYSPTVTWSISDITSDSASIRSGISRTTSMLERIEEENEEEEDYDEYEDDYDIDSYHSYSDKSSCSTGLLSNGEYTIDYTKDEKDDDIKTNVIETSIKDFDCIAQQQDQVMDVSDLDAIFTITSELVSTNQQEVDLEDNAVHDCGVDSSSTTSLAKTTGPGILANAMASLQYEITADPGETTADLASHVMPGDQGTHSQVENTTCLKIDEGDVSALGEVQNPDELCEIDEGEDNQDRFNIISIGMESCGECNVRVVTSETIVANEPVMVTDDDASKSESCTACANLHDKTENSSILSGDCVDETTGDTNEWVE